MRNKTYVAVLIACLVATGEAVAQTYCELERIHTRAKGDGVTADFSSVDTSTCALGIETTVFVDANVSARHVASRCGRGSTSSVEITDSVSNEVAVVIGAYDRCLGMPVLSVTGTGEAEELHLSPNRKTASLRATIEGTDEFDQPVSIAIDLVWDGVGHQDRTSNNVTVNHGIFRLVFHSSGTIRDASAAGTVSIDGNDVTPLPATQSTIEKDAARELRVWR